MFLKQLKGYGDVQELILDIDWDNIFILYGFCLKLIPGGFEYVSKIKTFLLPHHLFDPVKRAVLSKFQV